MEHKELEKSIVLLSKRLDACAATLKSDDVDRGLDMLEKVDHYFTDSVFDDDLNIAIVGTTGAGKSTVASFLFGTGKMVIQHQSRYARVLVAKPPLPGSDIRSGRTSVTLLPVMNYVFLHDYEVALWDMPGSRDTRGPFAELLVHFIYQWMLKDDSNVRFIIVSPPLHERPQQMMLENLINSPLIHTDSAVVVYTKCRADFDPDSTSDLELHESKKGIRSFALPAPTSADEEGCNYSLRYRDRKLEILETLGALKPHPVSYEQHLPPAAELLLDRFCESSFAFARDVLSICFLGVYHWDFYVGTLEEIDDALLALRDSVEMSFEAAMNILIHLIPHKGDNIRQDAEVVRAGKRLSIVGTILGEKMHRHLADWLHADCIRTIEEAKKRLVQLRDAVINYSYHEKGCDRTNTFVLVVSAFHLQLSKELARVHKFVEKHRATTTPAETIPVVVIVGYYSLEVDTNMKIWANVALASPLIKVTANESFDLSARGRFRGEGQRSPISLSSVTFKRYTDLNQHLSTRIATMYRSESGSMGSDAEESQDAPVDILPKEIRLAEDAYDSVPNTLVITVLQARHLQPAALRDTLSCYVKLSSLGVEYKTSVMAKTREPRWHEVFVFRAVDWTTGVTVSVRDRLPLKMHFIGQVVISSADIASLPGMLTQRWFQLRDKGVAGQFTGAELELKVALLYTKANDQTLFESGPAAAEVEHGAADAGLAEFLVGQEDETEEEIHARTKVLARREVQEREAAATIAALKQGNYQVQVHVIEARDLKGENLSGTSDPYCQVEILGLSKKTSTKYDTLGCVFDEILFFNFPNIGRHELREAAIKISVYDKERVLRDNLIGIYHLDCLSVYTQPDHELYRQWIAVHDNLNSKDRGIQGFLLVSVVVLGPGDALRIHDREAEIEQELAEATGETPAETNDAAITPLVLVPPAIELKLQFLVVRVLRAEHLPAMDAGGLLVGAQGIDAFIQVVFAANAPCKTTCVTVKGRGNLSPDFYEELWLPVRIPTFSRHIGLSVWDRDLTSPNELVGVSSHDFLQVPVVQAETTLKAPESPQKVGLLLGDSGDEEDVDISGELSEATTRETLEFEEEQEKLLAAAPRWYNLYGPPLQGTNSKRSQLLTRHAELGSTYRGRVLVSMVRIESPRQEDGEKTFTKQMSAPERERFERSTPKTVKYMFRGALFCGAELPRTSQVGLTGSRPQVRVTISLGPYSIVYESQDVSKDGFATFEQCLEHQSALDLPADLTQIPDIIVTLSRSVGGIAAATSRKEEFVSASFARFRAEELFSRGFTGKCQWVVMKEEISRRQTRYALESSQSPGVLLLRLGFGRVEVATRSPWTDDGDTSELFGPLRSPRVHREIRVHVFQARGLESPSGVTRVPSPFVNVRCCGQQKRTVARVNTSAPLFYESLVFLTNVPATDVIYTPEIVVQLQDASGSGSVLGELRLSLASAVRSVATAGSPKPRWYELKPPRSRSSSASSLLAELSGTSGLVGQVLVAIQYIDHAGLAPPEVLRQPAPIVPKYIEANLNIVALGVRHLKALSTLGVQRPHVEFELVGGEFVDGSSVKRTQPGIPVRGFHPSGSTKNIKLPGGYYVDRSGVKRLEPGMPVEKSIPSGSTKNANFLDRIVTRVKLPVDTLFAPQLQIRVCDSTLGGLRKTTLASCIVDLANKLPWSPTYRTEIADGAGSPFRSPSKRKTIGFSQDKKRNTGASGNTEEVNPDDEEEDIEYVFDEGQPEAEADYPLDNGLGVGDFNVPSVLHTHARVNTIKPLDDADPALIEQRRKEEERRYYAGKSALLLSHRSGKERRGSVLDSPRNNRDQEHHRAPYLRGRDWWISQFHGEELEKYFSTPALESYHLKRPVLTRPNLLSFERVRVQLRAGIFKGRITVTERRSKSDSRSQEEERSKQEYLELQRLKDGPQPVIVRVYVLRGQNLQAKNSNGYSDPYLRLKLGSNRINDRSNACTNTLQPEFFRTFEVETILPGASQLDISVWDRGLIMDQLIGSTTIDLEERWFHREWQEIGDGHSSPRKRGSNLKPIEYRHLYVPQNRSTSQGFLQLWVDILTTQEAARIEPVDICPPTPKKFEVRVVVWRAENVQDQVQSEINDYFVKAWMESSGDSGSSRAESTDTHWRCSNGKPCWNWRLVMKTEFPPRSPEMARLHIQLWDKDVLKWNDVLGEAQLDLYKWLRRAYETNRSVAPFLELKRLSRQSLAPGGEYHDDNTDENSSFDSAEDNSSQDEEVPEVTLAPREDNALLGLSPKKSSRKKRNHLPGIKKRRGPSPAERKLAKAQKDEADAEAAINGLLDFMGLGKLPDDAEWIPIYFTDREAAVSMEMGKIGISIQIVPEEEALASPVGKGQNAPNLNPYLPPPVGRMRFSANPMAMLKVLVGPKMCIRLSLLCCCVGCMLFISVFGATLMSTLSYLQAVESRRSSMRSP